MFKQTLIATLMAASSFAAYGSPYNSSNCGFSLNNHCCECAPNFGSDFYLGAGLGWGQFRKKESTDFVNRASGEYLQLAKNDQGKNGFSEELFLGYGYRFCRYYLAGELFDSIPDRVFRFNQTQASTSGTSGGVVVNFNRSEYLGSNEGVRLRPGYFLSANTLFYVPIGYVHSYYHANSNSAATNITEFKRPIDGGQIGWGIEQPITSCLSVRMGYLYTKYHKFTVTNLEIPDVTTNRLRHYDINTDEMVLDFSYHFGCATAIQPVCGTFGNGFYLGVEGGRTAFIDTTHSAQVLTDPVVADNAGTGTGAGHDSGNGGFGEAFVGYGRKFCNYYLGAEIGADWQHVKLISNITDANTPLAIAGNGFDNSSSNYEIVKSGYSADLIPGYFLTCNTMIYGRIGEKRSHFETPEFIAADAPQNATFEKDVNGLHVGVGLQTSLGCGWSLRTEVTNTSYKSYDFDTIGIAIPGSGNTTSTFGHEQHKHSVTQFGLGLVYTFM